MENTKWEQLEAKYPEAMKHADKKVGVVYLSDERKFAVLIHCSVCKAERVVRTSDLQWKSASFCLTHKPKASAKDVSGSIPTARIVDGKLVISLPANLNLKKEDVVVEEAPAPQTE